jgi:hypothetical protein
VKPNFIIFARRCLAVFSSWLAIAIMALYVGFKLMPLIGIHGSMKMGFHAAAADHAMAPLGNAFNAYLSIHLNYQK